MRQIGTILGTLLLCSLIFGCGGGSATTPAPEGTTNLANQPRLGPVAPVEVAGSHAVSIVPDRLSVRTGLGDAELAEVAGRYGCSVLSRQRGWATLRLPGGTDPEAAAVTLGREYGIVSAEPVHRIRTTRLSYDGSELKRASFTPLDPFYSAQFRAFPVAGQTGDGTNFFSLFVGQELPMSIMGFNAAWDVALSDDVAVEPVTIAIIDAGWHNYSTDNNPNLDETILDPVNSGYMADDGTFTSGLDAATWDVFAESFGDPEPYINVPYRGTGETILGILAARLNNYNTWRFETDDPPDDYQQDEIWNEGTAGINPNASYVLIKTGELDVDTWTFNDGHIANSIAHAVSAGANIIVLGMFGTGPVPGVISTELQNARDNDVLVFAPAGDVVSSFNGSDVPPYFDDTPVDITVEPVSPASDPNCVSVNCVGLDRLPELADIDGVPNIGTGWDNLSTYFIDAFGEPFFNVTMYSNLGADIAAPAFGIGFGGHPFLYFGAGTEAEPGDFFIADTYGNTLDSWSTAIATAYVAGAASQVFQTLSFVNATPPSDDDVLAELLNTVQLPNLDGTNGGGLLNAGAAMTSAINGGNLQTILPAMEFVLSPDWWSQPLDAVTRATDLTVTPLVIEGNAPFVLEVNWGDGSGAVTVDPWVNGDPLTLAGGYDTAGTFSVNVTVTDADERSVNTTFDLRVINPVAASISITNDVGAGVPLNNVPANTALRYSANATNVYTGMVGDPPAQNTTTIMWYFDGLPSPLPSPLPAPDATGPSPIYTYGIGDAGPVELVMVIVDDFRPPAEFRVNIVVSN